MMVPSTAGGARRGAVALLARRSILVPTATNVGPASTRRPQPAVAAIQHGVAAGNNNDIIKKASFSSAATAPPPLNQKSNDNGAGSGLGSISSSSSSSPGNKLQHELPPVDKLMEDIKRASKTNQGNPKRQVLSKRIARKQFYWDYEFCRTTADSYEKFLVTLADNNNNFSKAEEMKDTLLSPDMVAKAFTVLLKSKLKPTKLSSRVRDWERALGKIALTKLTPGLSLKLVEANGKSGNIGRTLSLLEYRTQQNYKPKYLEFVWAITAVEVSGWYLRHNRNIFLGDKNQPVIDNPTRWLDAILLNMNRRQFPLTQEFAVRMLDTFSTRGRTGKAMHYFYSVHKTPILVHEDEVEDDDNDDDEEMMLLEEEEGDEDLEDNDEEMEFNSPILPSQEQRPYKVRLKLKTPPPYYKIPTEVEGQLVASGSSNNKNKRNQKKARDGSTFQKKDDSTRGNAPTTTGVLKLDRESEPDWSIPITAAFSFADSLVYGACGHDPITLDLVCYNVLIKTCVYRGALWRAMHLLDTVMPKAGITPDARSYDSLLSGLSRVGDVTMMRNYYQQMLSKGIDPSYYTVQCIVEGLLNLGDVASAITVIQDFFNQHNVLPPVTTQLKVLEFALGLDMKYEAKRHVYFIQQLWKWQPHYQYETKEYIYLMKTYQRDPRISKEALKHLFRYFGETLEESDFF